MGLIDLPCGDRPISPIEQDRGSRYGDQPTLATQMLLSTSTTEIRFSIWNSLGFDGGSSLGIALTYRSVSVRVSPI